MRRLTPLLCLSLLGGCLTRPPVARLAAETPIAVGLVLDFDDRLESEVVPAALTGRVAEALAARNLVPRAGAPVAPAAGTFAAARDTSRRLEAVAELERGAPLLLLVETRARFFSQLNGRFRWTVLARVTLAERTALDDAQSTDLDFAAVLDFDHEREAEAVSAVATLLADQIGVLLDRFLAGRDAFPRAAARRLPAYDAIYFILVDRFANGNPANDGDADRADPLAWHGGDLQGVIDHLDDLKAQGVRTLWLSPLTRGRQTPFLGHGAFHGYWVDDHFALEPRFGTEADLARLHEELARRDMRLLLDVVLNHVSYDAPLVRQKPEWFHRDGNIEDWNDPTALVRGQVHGLPDLAQEHPEVYAHLLAASRHWIDLARPAGFRLDAVKHVGTDFWRTYNDDVRSHAGEDFLLLGELFEGNPATLAARQREGRFGALFDFPLHYAVKEVICGGKPAGKLGATLFADRAYDDPATLVTFLDNHDLPRIATACGNSIARVLQALTLMLTVRGTPCLTYGTEMAMTGKNEGEVRADMIFDTARAPNPEAARLVSERVRTLLAARRTHPALVAGDTRILALTPHALAFARVLGEEAVVVALSFGEEPFTVELPNDLAAAAKEDALAGVVVPEPRLTVPPQQARVLLVTAHTAEQRAALVALGRTVPATRFVDLRLSGHAPAGEVFAVGLGPELGDWDPERGVGPLRSGAGVRLLLPAGGVYELKLVSRHEGRTVWESRDNRYLFVQAGLEPLRVDLSWNQPTPT